MALKEYLSEALRRPIARASGTVRSASFEEFRQTAARADAMKQISKLLHVEVDAEDIGIAGADICNNVIDSYDSRFAEASLRTVSKKIVGTGMSVGHDMGGWSFATMFGAQIREPAGGTRASLDLARLREIRDVAQATWVQGQYYWPMKASWGQDLAIRITHGIAREVSAHWAFDLAVCSICNDDMRNCDHYPGESYEGKKCWYEMREVTDYIETAFVIKGGQYGTSTYPLGAEGRSLLPFSVAIREVKSSKRNWEDWKRELSDVLGHSHNGHTRLGAIDVTELKSPAELFARALKGAGAAQ